MRDGYPDRLDRLGRYPGNGESDPFNYLVVPCVDDADRAADFGGNPELRAIVGPYRATRAAIDENVGDDLVRGRVDDVRHVCGFGGVDEVLSVRADTHPLRFDAHRDLGHNCAAIDVDDRDEVVVFVGDVKQLTGRIQREVL